VNGEFRIGDRPPGGRPATSRGGRAEITSEEYPQLAALLAASPAELKAELDRLSTLARSQSGRPAAQQALQAAVHVIGELHKQKA
jgi:hypothetical protein